MSMLARAAQARDWTASPRCQWLAPIGTAVAAMLTLVSFTVIVRDATERAAGLASQQGAPQERVHAPNQAPKHALSQSINPSAPAATSVLGAATQAAR